MDNMFFSLNGKTDLGHWTLPMTGSTSYVQSLADVSTIGFSRLWMPNLKWNTTVLFLFYLEKSNLDPPKMI